jgi:hypothetical protein
MSLLPYLAQGKVQEDEQSMNKGWEDNIKMDLK